MYKLNEEWNSTIIQPNQIQGKEVLINGWVSVYCCFVNFDNNYKQSVGVSYLVYWRGAEDGRVFSAL